jgi:acyl-CoA thioesterase II
MLIEKLQRPSRLATAMSAKKRVWLRVPGCAGTSLREQQLALAFASDLDVLETAMRPHGVFWWTKGLQAASLDHAIWFHRPFDISEWHLFVQESPVAYGARVRQSGGLRAQRSPGRLRGARGIAANASGVVIIARS